MKRSEHAPPTPEPLPDLRSHRSSLQPGPTLNLRGLAPIVDPDSVESVTCAVEASVILPAYNEALALPEVLEDLIGLADPRLEIIVVDDGSTDDSASLAQRFPCHLLRHDRNRGKGAAVRTGLAAAHGRFIVVMDADNTYPAHAVPLIIDLLSRHDLVRSIRHDVVSTMPTVNKVGNWIFDSFLRNIYGLEGRDHLSGLYGLRREIVPLLEFTADGFDLEVEIGIRAHAHRLRTITIPISYRERQGEKKLHPWRDGWRILRKILTLTPQLYPALAFVGPGVLMWILTAVMLFVLRHGSEVVSHQTSIISIVELALGVMAGFQLLVFGVAAAMVGQAAGIMAGSSLIRLSHGQFLDAVKVTGGVLGAVGLATIALIAGADVAGGAWGHLRTLFLAGNCLLVGFQIAGAAMFLSTFASRLEQRPSSVLPEGYVRANGRG